MKNWSLLLPWFVALDPSCLMASPVVIEQVAVRPIDRRFVGEGVKLRNNARGRTAPCLDSNILANNLLRLAVAFSARASDSERRAFSAAIRSFSATGMELLLPISMLFLEPRTKIGQLARSRRRTAPRAGRSPVRMKRDGA